MLQKTQSETMRWFCNNISKNKFIISQKMRYSFICLFCNISVTEKTRRAKEEFLDETPEEGDKQEEYLDEEYEKDD